MVTVPHIPAIYNEDLVDACNHAGIQYFMLRWSVFRVGDEAEFPVTALNTAYAGNGLGICGASYRNNCINQFSCKDHSNVVGVLFTKMALTADVLPLWDAMHFYAADGIANFSLGFRFLSEKSSPEVCWAGVRLHTALRAYFDRGSNLRCVVSYGGSATNEIFRKIITQKVLEAQEGDMIPYFLAGDPVFTAARGAADLCK